VLEESERVDIIAFNERGRRISIVLDRKRYKRCDFLFLRKSYKDRPAENYEQIFWLTQRSIEQHRPSFKLVSHQTLVKADFKIALQLVGELDLLFEKGDNGERRLLCETAFKRANVRDGKIANVRDGKIVSFDLNSPFRLTASRAEGLEFFLSGQPEAMKLTYPTK